MPGVAIFVKMVANIRVCVHDLICAFHATRSLVNFTKKKKKCAPQEKLIQGLVRQFQEPGGSAAMGKILIFVHANPLMTDFTMDFRSLWNKTNPGVV